MSIALAATLCGPVAAAGPEEGLFNAARTMIANAEAQPEDLRLSAFRSAKELLDLIVSDYGESEIGQGIASGAVVQGMDIEALNAAVLSGTVDPERPVLEGSGVAADPAETVEAPARAAEELEGQPPAEDRVVIMSVPPEAPENQTTPPPGESQIAAAPLAATANNVPSPGAEPDGSGSAASQPTLPVFNFGAPPLDAGTEATEATLDLGRSEVRDIQARLLVLGFDPNGVDGQAGRGTRSALRLWQAENGVSDTGFLSATQLERLKEQSEPLLAAWLQNPNNAAQYDPPVIALTPAAMTGRWRVTTRCGANSRLGRTRIDGIMDVQHAGGYRYVGTVRQSQGLVGRFSGRLQGRQIAGETNWGLLLGRTSVRGTVADEKLAISGRDSNRCSFYAWKG